MDFKSVKKAYFIGIGGIGISALAKLLKHKGIEVSGLNDDESPATLNPLRELGIEVTLLSEYKNIQEADLYVYSDAWLYRGPEILKEAKKTGKPVLSYFEALGEIAKEYKVIAISGTHGKTTTTAMVAGVLIDAGLDPTVIAGSIVKKFNSNFRAGKSEYLVVEADEFNRHMLVFHPFVGAITNIETDHLDVYKDLGEIKEAFQKFLAQSEHQVTEKEYIKYLNEIPRLKVPGEHNRKNASVALAIADFLGITPSIALGALKDFSGTWRRFEYKGKTKNGAEVYDDYAHHPTEIAATISGARELNPHKKIIAVFQPHLFSRTKAFLNEFAEALKLGDEIYLLPIYYAREEFDPSVSSLQIADLIGEKAESLEDFEKAKERLIKYGGDSIILVMGAGDISHLSNKLFK